MKEKIRKLKMKSFNLVSFFLNFQKQLFNLETIYYQFILLRCLISILNIIMKFQWKMDSFFSAQAFKKSKQGVNKDSNYCQQRINEISQRQALERQQQRVRKAFNYFKQKIISLVMLPYLYMNKIYQIPLISITEINGIKISFWILLKLFGFSSIGISSGSCTAMIQSKFLGQYIAKSSLFSMLQSYGATVLLDPTCLTLLLVGGDILFLYWYDKNKNSNNQSNIFKLYNFQMEFLEKPLFIVPTKVSFNKQQKFDIQWAPVCLLSKKSNLL